MPEIYVSTDVETDGPIPGPHSMLSFASAAYRADKTLVSTFTANLQLLPDASGYPDTMSWWCENQAAYDARDLAALQLEIAHLRRQQQLDAQELEALRKRLAGRNPFSWLRTLVRATPLPSRLRRALSDRYRRARRRLA